MARFVYFYFMRDDPEGVGETAPAHSAYWQALDLPRYLGGPFADRSGGMITFEADSRATAQRLVDDDPFGRDDLLDRVWLQEWAVR